MYIYKKFALLVALIFLCSIMSSCEYPVFTQNISDYNTPQYPIGDRFFLDKIPDNADTIAFSFYEYRHEDFDLYLELKFKTLEEMEEYLKTLKNHVTNTSNLKNDESILYNCKKKVRYCRTNLC